MYNNVEDMYTMTFNNLLTLAFLLIPRNAMLN